MSCFHVTWIENLGIIFVGKFHGGMVFNWKSIDRCFDKFWTPEKKVIFMYSYEGHSMFEK